MTNDYNDKVRQDAQRVVDYLTQLWQADPQALHCLIETRVPVREKPGEDFHAMGVRLPDGGYGIGLLGVLNGLVGHFITKQGDLSGAVAAHYDEQRCLAGFRVHPDLLEEKHDG